MRLFHKELPSFLPSKCGAPALARVCGRFGRKRPFEIYRHLSTPGTIADTVGDGSASVRATTNKAWHRTPQAIVPTRFFAHFFTVTSRTGRVAEGHHRDRSTRASRRTIWRSHVNLKHSGRALHQRTVSTASSHDRVRHRQGRPNRELPAHVIDAGGLEHG